MLSVCDPYEKMDGVLFEDSDAADWRASYLKTWTCLLEESDRRFLFLDSGAADGSLLCKFGCGRMEEIF